LCRNEQQSKKLERESGTFPIEFRITHGTYHMAGADMADTDQVPASAANDDTPVAPSDAESGTSGPQSEALWIFGDVLPNNAPAGEAAEMHLPGDSQLLLTASVFFEAPANLDHALHQLTTATDLFEVPVLDFDSHSS
jgi:hypothetical protein